MDKYSFLTILNLKAKIYLITINITLLIDFIGIEES